MHGGCKHVFAENLPGSSDVKESACNAGDLVQPLGWEDYPLEGDMATHSNILARRIPMNRGAWQVTVHGVKQSDITERLSLSLFHTKATVHSKQLLQRVKLGQRAGSDMKNVH